MKKNNSWREIAREVNIDPQEDMLLARTLKALVTEADKIGEVPMPQGYEDHLIRALRTKLPLGKSSEQNAVGFWARIGSTFTMPQFRLQAGAALGFAVIAVVVSLSMRSHRSEQESSIAESMLIKTAKVSDEASVDSWISSISDSVSLSARRDVASLSEEITKGLNPADQKRILNNFVGQDSRNI